MSGNNGRILYVGLDPSRFSTSREVVHYPLIQIAARPFEQMEEIFKKWESFTHILFTSRTTVKLLKDHCERFGQLLHEKILIAVGKATAEALPKIDFIAEEETSEGIIALLDRLELGVLFYPHSAIARPLIKRFLEKSTIPFYACPLYTTIAHREGPLPHLVDFDEIIFTSPSTVHAFIQFYGTLPRDKKLTSIGPITQKEVTKCLDLSYINANLS